MGKKRKLVPLWTLALGFGDEGVVRAAFREAMTLLPISQAALAERLGVAQSTLSRWVSGKTSPTLDQMEAALEVMEESVREASARVDRSRRAIEAVREGLRLSKKYGKKRNDALFEDFKKTIDVLATIREELEEQS
ncbi:MAG: helix-turn-helix domain-containing protein [Acidobacteriota bacterium]